jgi:hypothetical protein
MTITIEIDGKKIKVEKNTTIIAAADKSRDSNSSFLLSQKNYRSLQIAVCVWWR